MESYEARVERVWTDLVRASRDCFNSYGRSERAVARAYDAESAKMGHVPHSWSVSRRKVHSYVERELGFDIVHGSGPVGILAAHPGVSGYCDFRYRTIAIKPQACKTLDTYTGQRLVMHECGHAIMHGDVEWDYDWLDERKIEWEAELFASVMTPRARGQSVMYLTQWYVLTANHQEVNDAKENVTKALWTIGRRMG